jgi:hypothetical protein
MATSATSRIEQATLPQPTLYLAFELGQNTWKLGFTIGVGLIPTLTLLANSPKRPMGTILEHNRGHWV